MGPSQRVKEGSHGGTGAIPRGRPSLTRAEQCGTSGGDCITLEMGRLTRPNACPRGIADALWTSMISAVTASVKQLGCGSIRNPPVSTASPSPFLLCGSPGGKVPGCAQTCTMAMPTIMTGSGGSDTHPVYSTCAGLYLHLRPIKSLCVPSLSLFGPIAARSVWSGPSWRQVPRVVGGGQSSRELRTGSPDCLESQPSWKSRYRLGFFPEWGR